jgi:hypothetical protein
MMSDASHDAKPLLENLRALRAISRADQHAFWLPLLIFGTLTCASAPMYVASSAGKFGWASAGRLAAIDGMFGQPGSDTRGVYWLVALAAGAAITALWYRWHGELTGLRTRVRGSVLAWLIGALVLVVISAFIGLVFQLWIVTGRGTSALLVIAAGFGVLSWIERSKLLGAITVIYTAAACVSVLYNPENQLFRVLGALGVPGRAMPVASAGTLAVLLPGGVLVIGAVVAVCADLRHLRGGRR